MNQKPSKHRLLVVDDEPQILVAISDLFDDEFRILTATDGWEALRLLEENEVSVILSDQRMPGMSGDEFLQRARDVSEATRVLITGYTDITALVRAVNVGKIHAYVSKPWNPVELRTIVMNAAAQYELTQDLAHERRLLTALMENTSDAIYFVCRDLRIERANLALARHMGIDDARSLSGRSLAEVLALPAGQVLLEDIRRVLESGVLINDKVERHEAPGGACMWMSTTLTPIRSNSGEILGVSGISRNVTNRRLAEEALQRAHDDLERAVEQRTRKLKQEIAERMRAEQALIEAKELAEAASRAKTAFLANMSHELRTPLNAIIGFADLIVSHILGPLGHEKYEEYIHNIHDSGQHLLQIISDILDVSRIEAGKIKLQETDIDVAGTCHAAWRMMEQLAEDGRLQATIELPGDLPVLLGDQRLVKQALLNLLSNAIKFTAPGGHVLLIADLDEQGALRIAVSDDGIGIAADDLVRVMEPFTQVESSWTRRHAGSGLGLPLAKAFVELHGGDLSVDSTPGSGTTVTMRFPPARVRRPETLAAD